MGTSTPAPQQDAWTLDVVAIEGGVGLRFSMVGSEPERGFTLAFDRPESRQLAQRILAAGGDGTERTFSPAKGGEA